jgi:WD40 repeat protein
MKQPNEAPIAAADQVHETQSIAADAPPTTIGRTESTQDGRATAAESYPTIPGYEILGVLGRGGMGVVFRARQVGLNRIVALKMIRGGNDAGPDSVSRFQAEAEAAARLRHPNIVQVYEVGTHDGQPFFSLEYVEGGTLTQRLARALPPPRDAAQLLRDLALAVAHAHAHGIIHRDLKPANVLLAFSDQPSAISQKGSAELSADRCWLTAPKITDFGLAKRLDCDTGQTQTGAILGTPSYMAPEQAAGGGKHVGPAADIYALGAIFYETLTGRPPFKGDTYVETTRLVLEQEPLAPRRLQPRLPVDLETICLKCLEKHPGRRYPSAVALADDLSRYLNGEPIEARPVGALERTWAWARRRPALAAACALAVVTVVFGAIGGGAIWLWHRAEQARDEAVAERGKADQERKKAEAAEQEATTAKEREQALLELNRVQLALREWSANDVSKARRLLAMGKGKGPLSWEAAYVDNLTRPLMELPGHAPFYNSTCHLAVSHVGNRLATSDGEHVVRIWDLTTGKLLAVCEGTELKPSTVLTDALPRRLAFTPDGTRLVGTRGTETVYFWDAATGKLVDQLRPKGASGVSSLAVRPDGKQLAVGYFGGPALDTRVRLWDVEKQTESVLKGHASEVIALAYNPEGSQLASGSSDGTVRIWDVAEAKEHKVLKVDRKDVTQLSWGRNEFLAAVGSDGFARIWDVETWELLRTLKVPGVRIESVAFRADGKQLATGLADGSIAVWDDARGETPFMLRAHLGAYQNVHLLAYTRDGKRLVSAANEGVVRVWDATTPQEVRTLKLGPQESGRASAISADGRWIALSKEDKTITIWDARSGEAAGKLVGHQNPPQAMALNNDGSLLAAANGGDDIDIRIWDVRNQKGLRTLSVGNQQIWDLAFHPDGKRLLGGGDSRDGKLGEVRIWNVDGTGEPRTLLRFTSGVRRFDVSQDGKWVAAVDQAGVLKACRLEEGVEIYIADPKENTTCYALKFSPDGRLFIAAESNGDVVYWDTHQWRVLARVPDELFYMSLAFTPDGKRLAGTRADGRITLWDVATQHEALNLGRPARSSMGKNMRFTDEGRKLLAVDSGSELRIFAAPAYGK